LEGNSTIAKVDRIEKRKKKRRIRMDGNRLASWKCALGLFFAVLALASHAAAQSNQVQGLITGRSGATMALKTQDGEAITVLLTADTQVQEDQGLFRCAKRS
jgi:hypothetical protein